LTVVAVVAGDVDDDDEPDDDEDEDVDAVVAGGIDGGRLNWAYPG
jgi:hypothetical protein